MLYARTLNTQIKNCVVLATRFSSLADNRLAGKSISFTCADDTVLYGTVFSPPRHEPVKSAILMAPATGVPRYFYCNFSQWLSKHGHAVLTFDNRGIGDSLQGDIRSCEASIVDWGTLDMPSAWSELQEQFPDARDYHIAGHSAGGQIVGLMHNAVNDAGDTTITSMFNVSCSSGSLSHMDSIFGLQARWFLNIFIPFSNYMFGYSRTDVLGMGGPLPYHVGRQWNEWCSARGYIKTAFGVEVNRHWYDELSCPSIWIHSSDDGIANLANIEDMLSVHSREFQDSAEVLTLRPNDYGLEEIGHMNYFSSKNAVLWNVALEWFDKFHRQ